MADFEMHAYSVVLVNSDKKFDKTFLSRSAATSKVYELCEKFCYAIVDKYEDHHDITYVCDNGAKFCVNRIY